MIQSCNRHVIRSNVNKSSDANVFHENDSYKVKRMPERKLCYQGPCSHFDDLKNLKTRKQTIPKRPVPNKRPVSNKRPPLRYQKQISAPGAKSNHYGSFVFKKRRLNERETPVSVFRLDGFAQVTQPLVCLHILFCKLHFFFL